MKTEIISKLISGNDISIEESELIMSAIADNEISSIHTAAFLTALATKGETADEIAGCVQAFRKRALKVPHHQEIVFDCCGTGGDCSGSFNISTAVAFVIAACGISTAKHGNSSVSSLCGSADVLEEIGVKINLRPESAATCLDELGICFMFAPSFHPAMKNVAPVRKELGFRTIFNLIGPLLNPAEASHQIIGAANFEIAEKLAMAVFKLNVGRVSLLHNSTGLDELAPFGENWLISADFRGIIKTKLNLPVTDKLDITCIKGGDAKENAQIIWRIFEGEISPRYRAILLNAGVGLFHVGTAADYVEGMEMADEAIVSGKAKAKLEQLIELSNKLE